MLATIPTSMPKTSVEMNVININPRSDHERILTQIIGKRFERSVYEPYLKKYATSCGASAIMVKTTMKTLIRRSSSAVKQIVCSLTLMLERIAEGSTSRAEGRRLQ